LRSVMNKRASFMAFFAGLRKSFSSFLVSAN
jgi:hypothetical protein